MRIKNVHNWKIIGTEQTSAKQLIAPTYFGICRIAYIGISDTRLHPIVDCFMIKASWSVIFGRSKVKVIVPQNLDHHQQKLVLGPLSLKILKISI